MPSTYEEKLAAYEKRWRETWHSWYGWSRGRPGYEILARARQASNLQVDARLGRDSLIDILTESEVGRPPRRPRI